MAVRNGKLGSWSSVDVAIDGEPLAKDGLRKRRKQLEAVVEPLVTARKTDNVIQFRGKRRYLTKPPFMLGKINYHAVLALQHLYNIEAAWEAGDIDRVVRATFGFAKSDTDQQLVEMTGVDSVDGAFSTARGKQNRRNTRLGKSKLHDVPDIVLQTAYHTCRGKHDWLRSVRDEIVRHRGGTIVSTKTVSSELRKRGIVE